MRREFEQQWLLEVARRELEQHRQTREEEQLRQAEETAACIHVDCLRSLRHADGTPPQFNGVQRGLRGLEVRKVDQSGPEEV